MPSIQCAECKNQIEEESSRKWKGDRICHTCYKGKKKERQLERIAQGL